MLVPPKRPRQAARMRRATSASARFTAGLFSGSVIGSRRTITPPSRAVIWMKNFCVCPPSTTSVSSSAACPWASR
jgi:hypothetical protein